MVIFELKIGVTDSVNTADFSRVKIDILDIGFDELHVTKNAPERVHDVARRKIAGSNFMKHRREENEILAADQRNFDIVATGQRLVEILRCVKSAESAARNNDFGFHYLGRGPLPNTYAKVIEPEERIPLSDEMILSRVVVLIVAA